jgi:hypothetical protein
MPEVEVIKNFGPYRVGDKLHAKDSVARRWLKAGFVKSLEAPPRHKAIKKAPRKKGGEPSP